jgi:hypothetical protein
MNDDRFFELPDGARNLVRVVEALIAEAAPLVAEAGAPPELSYELEQMKTRYLPETIAAFLAIPASQRTVANGGGETAAQLLLEQLSVLERAARRDLRALAERRRSELQANARFLSERFEDRSTEISSVADAPPAAASQAAPAFAQWLGQAGTSAAETVAFVGTRLRDHFPGITQLRSSGLFGMGNIEAVSVTLVQGGGIAFRYTLSAAGGVLDASVAKLVHGTVIQTVRCSTSEWLQSLYDDIVEQARRHEEMRAPLARLFST